jgi:ABC-type sugar transport system substrate-binding protein
MLKLTKLAALAAAFVLAAGAAQAQSLKGKRVALLTGPTTTPWVAAYFKQFIANLAAEGIDAKLLSSPGDVAVQAQHLDDAVAQRNDLIVLNAINEVAVVPALERAKAAKIPVVLVQQEMPGREDLFVTYVGDNARARGVAPVETMVKALAAKGAQPRLAVIQGAPGQFQVIQINAGLKELLSKTNVQIAATEGTSWRIDEAGANARRLLVRFQPQGGLQGFYTMMDPFATQVIQAIEAGGQKPGQDVLVFSSSCTKDGIQAVRDGKLFATVDNGPIKIAEAASKVVVQVLRGERTAKTIYTPSTVVTKANVEQHAGSCTF